MSWIENTLDLLAENPIRGYYPGSSPAVEPTALAAMALAVSGRSAVTGLDWLASQQASDGGVWSEPGYKHPRWSTGWAVLAWQTADVRATQHSNDSGDSTSTPYSEAIDRAVKWILAARAKTQPNEPAMFGHDTTLEAWSWVADTHSWVEPTAIIVTALRATGHGEHPRCRQGVELLRNRMLPDGGWNYGNTVVLGNTLRPHIQPTGLALVALAGEPGVAERIAPSIDYLRRALSAKTPTASLCYGLMGLIAQGARPTQTDAWLETSCQRTLARDASPYKLALVALTAHADQCSWRLKRGQAPF